MCVTGILYMKTDDGCDIDMQAGVDLGVDGVLVAEGPKVKRKNCLGSGSEVHRGEWPVVDVVDVLLFFLLPVLLMFFSI